MQALDLKESTTDATNYILIYCDVDNAHYDHARREVSELMGKTQIIVLKLQI